MAGVFAAGVFVVGVFVPSLAFYVGFSVVTGGVAGGVTGGVTGAAGGAVCSMGEMNALADEPPTRKQASVAVSNMLVFRIG